MTEETFRLLTAASHFVAALLWGTIAVDVAEFLLRRRPKGALPRVVLALTCCTTTHYATWTCAALLRHQLQGRSLLRGVLMTLTDSSVILVIALGRHCGVLWSRRSSRPTRGWLAVNYGLAAAMIVTATLGNLFALSLPGWQTYTLYILVLGVALIFDFFRSSERGAWRPGGLWQARSADVVVLGVALALVAVAQIGPAFLGTSPLALMLTPLPSAAALAVYVLNGTAALVFAVPLVIRNLGDLLPRFLASLAATIAVFAIYAAARTTFAEPATTPLVEALAVATIALVVMPARTWLQASLARLLFRRGRLRWAELHDVIHGLPPEAGVGECCRRTLAELLRTMGLRGAAILLRDGSTFTEGAIDVRPLEAAWPRDGAGVPAGTIPPLGLRDLAPVVSNALTAADVLVVVPIASPRRAWGWIFVTTDLRGASFGDEDDAAVGAATDQLALTLDAADLLARAVAVERSLAHAEKLAAIGELAARFAHEIRNPVTAARSLAQQLARDPTSPLNAEHAGIILEELERVERQIRDLLHFARREELRLERVDLGALVRATARDFGARCAEARVTLALDTPEGVVARADAGKVRQVLVNLVENALDALGNGGAEQRMTLAVTAEGGTAALRVVDTGPGIPPEALGRIFDPFVSFKAGGTGLGLAIARRTVDAHGGTLAAESRPGETVFCVRLPLDRETAAA